MNCLDDVIKTMSVLFLSLSFISYTTKRKTFLLILEFLYSGIIIIIIAIITIIIK